jgi:multiple antibiotic resistance protein
MALDEWIHTFVVLFVVVDPIGQAPIFVALTQGESALYCRRMAVKGTGIAALILLVVVLVGDTLLQYLGISLPAFRIAGGILLFLLAVDMVFARQSGLRGTTREEELEACQKEDISVFPLAFPLIAGPGAITTILLTTAGNRASFWVYAGLLLALALVLCFTLLSLLLAFGIGRLLGDTGANVISRLLGLILAALATQFVLDGLAGVQGGFLCDCLAPSCCG